VTQLILVTNTNQNNDTDTNFTTPMQQIDGIMIRGPGRLAARLKKFCFWSRRRRGQNLGILLRATDWRSVPAADTTWCTTIKNRGIFIAVLYTEYLPLPELLVQSMDCTFPKRHCP
jgi:hypothetical protein